MSRFKWVATIALASVFLVCGPPFTLAKESSKKTPTTEHKKAFCMQSSDGTLKMAINNHVQPRDTYESAGGLGDSEDVETFFSTTGAHLTMKGHAFSKYVIYEDQSDLGKGAVNITENADGFGKINGMGALLSGANSNCHFGSRHTETELTMTHSNSDHPAGIQR